MLAPQGLSRHKKVSKHTQTQIDSVHMHGESVWGQVASDSDARVIGTGDSSLHESVKITDFHDLDLSHLTRVLIPIYNSLKGLQGQGPKQKGSEQGAESQYVFIAERPNL